MRRRRALRAGLVVTALALAAGVVALTTQPASAAVGGSGPYPAGYETQASLPNHTIFRPETLPTAKLPVVVWGNGGCMGIGTMFQNFLTEIASHGFLVIVNGAPNGGGVQETYTQLTESMDWVVKEATNPSSKYYGKVDTTKIAVGGQSCGGLEAYYVATDPRITTITIFNSGLLTAAEKPMLQSITKPIAYFIGGSTDIAYANAMDDWAKLPQTLPAWMGNINAGHMGTYAQANGGEFGRVAVLYYKWRLMDDKNAGAQFVGTNCGLCKTWTVQQRNLTL